MEEESQEREAMSDYLVEVRNGVLLFSHITHDKLSHFRNKVLTLAPLNYM